MKGRPFAAEPLEVGLQGFQELAVRHAADALRIDERQLLERALETELIVVEREAVSPDGRCRILFDPPERASATRALAKVRRAFPSWELGLGPRDLPAHDGRCGLALSLPAVTALIHLQADSVVGGTPSAGGTDVRFRDDGRLEEATLSARSVLIA